MNKKTLRPEKPKEREQYTTARPYCYNCDRPKKVCVCSKINKVSNSVNIGILRHPNEVKKTFNTAIIAHLSLKKSFLLDDLNFDLNKELELELSKYKENEIGILFPSKNSIPLESGKTENLKCLLVLDGTWNEAKKLGTKSDTLKNIQHYSFTPPQKSDYLLRKEPHESYVCTLEAIGYSLQLLEKDSEKYLPFFKNLHILQEFQKEMSNKNSRHKNNKQYWDIKKRIKEINLILYSSNVENIETKDLIEELKKLQEQIKTPNN